MHLRVGDVLLHDGQSVRRMHGQGNMPTFTLIGSATGDGFLVLFGCGTSALFVVI